MQCLTCGSAQVTERPERTAQGYRRFRCRACGKQFNERTGGLLNRTQYPSDVIALVVLWRLRYKLSLRDLPEMFLGRCQVDGRRAGSTLELRLSLPCSGDEGSTGDLAPNLEGTITGGSMVGGGDAVATKLEVIMELTVRGEESLGMAGRLEPLHLPFSPSRRLVRDLGAVVEVAALPVLDPGQDLALGRAVTRQLVRHDDTRHVLQALEQLLEEALGRLGVAPALHQDVEHGAVLVDCPPEVRELATDADEHLIQRPFVARPWPAPFERVGECPPERRPQARMLS